MTDDLQHVAAWANAVLARLSPSARRRVLRQLATDLRRSQQQRIAAQQAPDGSAYTPRRPPLRSKRGRLRNMFAKLRTSRFLHTTADATGLSVGFTGRVARIARVHQFGERDEVRPGGPTVTYPERILLGFSNADLALITDRLIQMLEVEDDT